MFPDLKLQNWLVAFVRANGGVAGTVHVREGGNLVIAAAHNIPPPVIQITGTIPKGKGMAGLAWERGVPVQTCNLQTDKTGDVKPGARAVNAQAAIALPVSGHDGEIRAVVGIAFAHECEISDEQAASMAGTAAALPA